MRAAAFASSMSVTPAQPREISFFKPAATALRFDFDGRYADLSTRTEAYQGHIVTIVDLKHPARPVEVSRWWLPGAVGRRGEKPYWGYERYDVIIRRRFGDRLEFSYCMAVLVILDIFGRYRQAQSHSAAIINDLPPFFTCTFVPRAVQIRGKSVAVAARTKPPPSPPRNRWRRSCGCLMSATSRILSRCRRTPCRSSDTPSTRAEHGGRFGVRNQRHERMTDSLVHVTWFRGRSSTSPIL